MIDQADIQQQIERTAPSSEMTPQSSAGSITDAEFLDQGGVVQSAMLEITRRFRMAMELELTTGKRERA